MGGDQLGVAARIFSAAAISSECARKDSHQSSTQSETRSRPLDFARLSEGTYHFGELFHVKHWSSKRKNHKGTTAGSNVCPREAGGAAFARVNEEICEMLQTGATVFCGSPMMAHDSASQAGGFCRPVHQAPRLWVPRQIEDRSHCHSVLIGSVWLAIPRKRESENWRHVGFSIKCGTTACLIPPNRLMAWYASGATHE